jgi:RNA polymerase sigma factor (sigma-70 family)
MSAGPTQYVAHHVRDLIERQRLDALADRELLSLFVVDRDDAAFAALVRRHGPMVLGVCRRILRHPHDAEDACQAVFLVLARKAGTVRGRHALAGWLHRVAVRAAGRLRAERARRTAEPLPPDLVCDLRTPDESAWREVRGAFDAEVARLPDKFRLPLVLCCLEGKTRTEAASELGWSEGAVRGRLERGRKLLQARFARKGLALPATLLPMLLKSSTPAAPAAPDLATSSAARLADGIIKSMAVARAKLAAWATAAILLLGTVAGLSLYGRAGAQPKPAESPPTSPETPAATAIEAEKNLDTFVLRVSLAPAGEGKFDPKYTLYHVLLYVPNLRLEPPANGPSGKPVEAHARITKEQVKKIVAALNEFGFFTDAVAKEKLQLMNARNWPHVGITARYQGGEDAATRERLLAWLPTMLPPLDAIRASVDGDAAKALDQLIGQLADDRKRWGSTLDEDLRRLQGAWAVDLTDDDKRLGLISGQTAKCVFDGKKISLKPKVQLEPLIDLETIRGTFELQDTKPRRMVIKGTRDTVSKLEPGTWTVLYEVSDTILTLLLPPAGKDPPADAKPRHEQGDRQFTLKRTAPEAVSPWGEVSKGLSTRIRAARSKYPVGVAPVLELDVRDVPGDLGVPPARWRGHRLGTLAQLEVDGVTYKCPQDLRKLMTQPLKPGEEARKWVTIDLGEEWSTTGGFGGKRLVLAPGKHTIRVGFTFYMDSPDPIFVTATPVSGPLGIEVLPARAPHASEWGTEWNGLQIRARTDKSRFISGEAVSLSLDVRANASNPKPVPIPRANHRLRVEVDGHWYQDVRTPGGIDRIVDVAPGKELDDFVFGTPGEFWASATAKRPPAWALGKHTIRVGYDPGGGEPGKIPLVSNTLEIEIVPARPGEQVATASNWGESSNGVSARIRTARPRYKADDDVEIELDVKADKTRSWHAGRVGHLTRVEVDGVWYVSQFQTREYILPRELPAGQEVSGWVNIQLGPGWVVEKTRNERSPQALSLKPGKHTVRVGFTFWSDGAEKTSASPVSGPLEVEVLPAGKE